MGLLPDTWNCRLRMRWECRERFPCRWFQRKPPVSDPVMHHGMCVTHMPCCMLGSLTCGGVENVPGIPGACATGNFTYLQEAHDDVMDTVYALLALCAGNPPGLLTHDNVMTLKHFLLYWPLCRESTSNWGIHSIKEAGLWWFLLLFAQIDCSTIILLAEAEWCIYVLSSLVIIGSDIGLLPVMRQAIIWTSADLLSIGTWGTKFSEILIEIQTLSFKKMQLKMCEKWHFVVILSRP